MEYKHYWSSQRKGEYVIKSITDDVKQDTLTTDAKLADYSFMQANLRNMLGRVLTVIDASITDEKQNKAVKDIIRNEFIEDYAHLSEMLSPVSQEEIDAITMDMTDEEINNLQEATIEEVAGH